MTFNRIAIVKLSSLGDIVHTLPALSVIRSEVPAASVTWFAEPPGAELLTNFSGIDHIVSVDLKSGSTWNRFRNLRRLLSDHRGKFDLIIDFQGLIKSAVLSRLLGKNTVGFSKINLREAAARFFYKETSSPFDESGHVIRKNIHLLSVAGIFSDDIVYPLKALSSSHETDQFMEEEGLEPGGYVILNIGGSWETKLLSHKQNLDILAGIDPRFKKVLLWGNRAEGRRADLLLKVYGTIKAPFLNFSDLMLFISKAGAVISADSLPLHLADATGTRSVGIFGPTSPGRNGSLNKNNLSVVNEIDCSFCHKRTCSHKSCLDGLNLSRITDFINRG